MGIASSLRPPTLTWLLLKPWDEKDAKAVEEEFSLEDLFGDELPGSKDEL